MLQSTPHQAAYTVIPSLKSFLHELPTSYHPTDLCSW